MRTLSQNYWDNLLNQNFSLKGVGWPNWPETFNEIVYKKYLKGFLKVVNDLEVKYNFKIDNSKNVLEVGPGTGFYTNILKNLGVEKLLGIDISQISIDGLKKIFKNFEFQRLSIYEDLEFFEKNKEKFDLGCVIDVLLHIVDDIKHKQAIKNICKMVKSGGYIITGDTATVYRKKNFSEGSKYDTDVSRHIEYIKDVFAENDVELVGIYSRECFLLAKNYDFKYSFFEKLNNFFFFFLNGGLTRFRNNNLIGLLVGYPLSFLDSMIVPFQKYSKNNKFLLFRKK